MPADITLRLKMPGLCLHLLIADAPLRSPQFVVHPIHNARYASWLHSLRPI